MGIAALRNRHGLSQSQLAALAGVSQPNLSAYESGRREPRPETLSRILNALRRRPSEILAEQRESVLGLARRYGFSNVRVFGSSVRGEDGQGSDIHLLVDFWPGTTLFDVAAFRLGVVDLPGTDVDIVPADAAGPAMSRIRQEAVPL